MEHKVWSNGRDGAYEKSTIRIPGDASQVDFRRNSTALKIVSLGEFKKRQRDPIKRLMPVGTVPAGERVPIGGDVFQPPNDGITDTNVVYHGGAIADGVPIVLIYWGSAWSTAANPTLPEFDAAARSLVSGPFPSQLEQYGVGRPWVKQSIQVTTPEAPGSFSEVDVEGMVSALIESGQFPEPDEDGGKNYYCVIMPSGSLYDTSGILGSHWWPDTGSFLDPDTAWLGWIGNADIDTMTRAFGHELAELCTDPEGDGWYVDSLGYKGEIGDLCNTSQNYINGVWAEYYWSNAANACVLPTTIQTFSQNTIAAAVSSTWNQIEIFAVEIDGGVYMARKRNETWHNWGRIGIGEFSQNTAVAAVSKNPGQIDLFAVGEDGGAYTAWWSSEEGWGDWGRVSWGEFAQLTPIAVVSKYPGQIDLFAVGEDGGAYTAWWSSEEGWGGWGRVSLGEFAQLTPIAVVSKNPGQIDIFAVGEDGGAYTAWWSSEEGWGGWRRVASGAFAQQTPIAAVSKSPGQIDLFAVGSPDGPDGFGGVYTAWWNAEDDWSGWSRVAFGAFAQQTPIAAVSKNPGQIDLFAIGGDGGAYTAWWNAEDDWTGWKRVGSGIFAQQTPITAVSKSSGEIDLFAVGEDGRVYTAWWNGNWNDWTCVL
jgi:hypothetical protein